MVLHALALAGGALIVAAVLSAAVRTVVVPRGEHVLLSTLVFGVTRWAFRLFAKEAHSYARRDRVMARFAPTALMALPIVWALGVVVGFTPIYWTFGEHNWADALLLSGSSLTTLGFRSADSEVAMFASIIEALLGLGLVALLISFLPTIYGQFSRRERTVAQLYMWAEDENGVSDPVTLIARSHQIGGLHRLDQVWDEWDTWFVELSESHRSFPSLNFFRSPDPDRSWINGAGIALDLAALYLSALDIEANPRAAMMLRSGFLSLRSLCSFFDIPFDARPAATDPISITRSEVEAAVDRLAAAGVPVRGDRDAIWRDFSGWRVNYDGPLTYLADFTMAPYQPWVSDRAVRFRPSVRARAAARRDGRRGA